MSHPSAQKVRRNQKLAAITGHVPLKLMAMVEIKIIQTLSEKSSHAETQPDRILTVAYTVNPHTCPTDFRPGSLSLLVGPVRRERPNRDAGPHIQMTQISERAWWWRLKGTLCSVKNSYRGSTPVADSENPREKWVGLHCSPAAATNGVWGRPFKLDRGFNYREGPSKTWP